MGFVDEVETLAGRPVAATTTMTGGITIVLDAPMCWSELQNILKRYDKTMVINGKKATFDDLNAEAPAEGIALSCPSSTFESGSIKTEEFTNKICTCADLDVTAKGSNVLKVVVGPKLIVQTVIPSDIKDGLYHLHRRGKVRPRKLKIDKVACKRSKAAKLAYKRTKSRLSTVKKLKLWLGY